MSDEKITEIFCRQKKCRSFLCRSDGTYLFVDGLQIEPVIEGQQTKHHRQQGKSIRAEITCDACGCKNRVWLRAAPPDHKPHIVEGRKFLIFRSRFR